MLRTPIKNTEYDPMRDAFGKFGEMFKRFTEEGDYESYEDVKVYFDSNMLELTDTTNIELIIDEINHISRRLYMYGVIVESQEKIVQELEDEYIEWFARAYILVEDDTEYVPQKGGKVVEKKISRTETAKEKKIIHTYREEFSLRKDRLRTEKYKLGIVKRAVDSLNTYSYKLHAILNYRQLALEKKL